ncbi:hypothetical protein [Frankia nepalensis]|uniref:Acyl-CoA thioesterase n=1 Tax=Frankia nepalensis TaxID=1836974 RepID=A0A937UL74_9ACTN|nr:hypothetical protein [Frankia nepalensis]MBL7502115.1 hypothetical protein [Frankia nepalensis]MBL7512896.1 hypothetical protein [Frankia nepalensis]MBL7625738.1 hypothetical protein [Frankia nepalensis]
MGQTAADRGAELIGPAADDAIASDGVLGTVVVPARFNGPPGSANGGWISGTVAGFLAEPAAEAGTGSGWAAEAALRAPTPLEVPLAVEAAADGGVRLVQGETVLVEARAANAAGLGEPPPFVGFDEAEQAAAAAAAAAHPFADCFGCGTARAVGDGLRLLAGQVAGGPPGLVAVPWTVDPSLAGPDGTIGRHLLWSALDCPSFWAHRAAAPGEDVAALLARQTVVVTETVRPGETYVVVATADSAEGRKLRSSSAIYTPDGHLLAASAALWIRVQLPDQG